jgi:hypothetical protein
LNGDTGTAPGYPGWNAVFANGAAVAATGHEGVANTAVHFSGDDRIQVQAGGQISETNFGVSMWFKTPDSGTVGLFCLDYAGHDRHVYISAGSVRVRTWPHGTKVVGGGAVNDNQWHQLAYSVGPSGERVYLDGSLLSHRSGVTSSHYNWDQHAYIGWSTDAGFFRGDMDDVKIFNHEISDSEADQLAVH